MPRLLYGVSPIGLGHASRAVAVGEELGRRGMDVEFASGGNAAEFLSSYGFRVHDVITEPSPRVSGGVMKDASLWYLRYWMGYRRSKSRMAELIADLRPDLVVGDEEFSGVSVAMETGRKHALLSDELELGFGRSPLGRAVERRVSNWYLRFQEEVAALIIPDEGTDSANRHFVGPIVRARTRSREQVLGDLALPKEGRMVLYSLSGSGLGEHLLTKTVSAVFGMSDAYLVISGNRGSRTEGERVYDVGVQRDNQDLVAAADLVVSTAGKSTIDESASFGTPIIAIPIKNHAEQEGNAAALGYCFEDSNRLGEIVRDKIGRRTSPADYQGSVRVADLLVSLLG